MNRAPIGPDEGPYSPASGVSTNQVSSAGSPSAALSSASAAGQAATGPGYSLIKLERIIREIYLPLIEQAASSETHETAFGAAEGGDASAAAPKKKSIGVSVPKKSADAAVGQKPDEETSADAAGTAGARAPAARRRAPGAAAIDGDRSADTADHLRDEFAVNLNKFASHLSHAIQQVTGSMHVSIPDFHLDPSPAGIERAAKDPDVTSRLESYLEEWTTSMANVIDHEHRKRRVGDRPLSEILYWRDRDAALAAVYEQLNVPRVKTAVEVLSAAGVAAIVHFNKHLSELLKMYTEAKDNVKFLSTLERHLKNLATGSLTTLLETIPTMLNSLRMVWVVSRHYNKDSRMFPLMTLIAREIADRVAKEVSVRTIFRMPPQQAMTLIRGAREVLNAWHTEYAKTRQKIEESGSARWEFNRSKLFDLTDYMSSVCGHLLEVAETLDQFAKFLSPQLKSITGDPHGIDDVIQRVQKLIVPLEHFPFHIFDPRYQSSWDQQRKEFKEEVLLIEERTKLFIHQSFKKLRSAEGAFNLLQNFSHIVLRRSIRDQLKDKYRNILEQFGEELKLVHRQFERYKDNPPITKSEPRVAGAIAWARSLFQRIKKPILRFKTMEGLLEDEEGHVIKQAYIEVARLITSYEKRVFAEWAQSVERDAPAMLREKILVRDMSAAQTAGVVMGPVPPAGTANARVSQTASTGSSFRGSTDGPAWTVGRPSGGSSHGSNTPAAGTSGHSKRTMIGGSLHANASLLVPNKTGYSTATATSGASSAAAGASAAPRMRGLPGAASAGIVPAEEPIGTPGSPIRVNFAPALRDIIAETKHLDRMGLSADIPEIAINVALQEEKYYHLVERLSGMLNTYKTVLDRLGGVEFELLSQRVASLEDHMRPGFTTYNWSSLGVDALVDKCLKEIAKLDGVVSHVQKNSVLIDKLVQQIRETALMDVGEFEALTEAVSVEDFYDSVEKHRASVAEDAVHRYGSITRLLLIIEQHVCESDSGWHPQMAGYYRYWERRIFHALTAMIANGLLDFQRILNRQPTRAAPLPTAEAPAGARVVGEGERVDAGLVGVVPTQAEATPAYLNRRLVPLIKITASLRGDVNDCSATVVPTVMHVIDTLSKLQSNITQTAKGFVRWMRNTCRESHSVSLSDEKPIIYTFASDTDRNPVVKDIAGTGFYLVQSAMNSARNFLDEWQTYNTTYQLFNQKKLDSLSRLMPSADGSDKQSKSRPPSYFDHKLEKYSLLARSVRDLPPECDLNFLRIDCRPLIDSIAVRAQVWVNAYGQIQRIIAEQQLNRTRLELLELARKLQVQPQGLDELKAVLNVIASIHAMSLRMELTFDQIIEKFDTLARYNIPCQESDREAAHTLHLQWRDWVASAELKSMQLQDVKAEFKTSTSAQVESFKDELAHLRAAFEAEGPGAEVVDVDSGLAMMSETRKQIEVLEKRMDAIALSEKLVDLPPTSYRDFYDMKKQLGALDILYAIYQTHKTNVTLWSKMGWKDLDINHMMKTVKGVLNSLSALVSKRKAALAQQQAAQQLPQEEKSGAAAPPAPVAVPAAPPAASEAQTEFSRMPLYSKIQRRVEEFSESLPVIGSLKGVTLEPRHWSELMSATGVSLNTNLNELTLTDLLAMQLNRFKDVIAQITSNAAQEAKIEKEIDSIQKQWAEKKFELTPYEGDEQRGMLLMDTSELVQQLEDHVVTLQQIGNSPFAAPFRARSAELERELNQISECISIWMQVQRKWMYLEGIFKGSEDIRNQIPEAWKKFEGVDVAWHRVMLATKKLDGNVKLSCQADHRIDTLRALWSDLEQCQKKLSDYLERKRIAFPRFFFISDDELLSILGSSSPSCVQSHMLKLFANTKSLSFIRGDTIVTGMASPNVEKFDFRTHVPTEGAVEVWMSAVEAEMIKTLRQITKEAVYYYAKMPRLDWVMDNLGMVAVAGSQIWWTWEVEDAFWRVKKGQKLAMKKLAFKLVGQLEDLVTSIRDPTLASATRSKLNTLVIIDVHARDIIDRFVRDSILDAREFDWESQLRFYWNRDLDDMLIRQCTGQFKFGYEYQGLNGRLVITPLTDRCYMTLTQALTFHLGGSPAGPAGTGKTETVKDLAKAMGLLSVVTNCGEGLDYKAMGSIFSGLVQTGAWGCFDEFNRIDVEVLSVVSSQLTTIQTALNLGKTRFEFLGNEIQLKNTVGFFVTMNPGYAGRTELPDNLKALFRPVTMIVPDLPQICEIMLFSEGFLTSRNLAQKMTVLYRQAQEQLSKQHHYDFGLRALKSVLVMAGSLKRASPEFSEELVLMRALRDMNLPKFVFEDVPLFLGLIADLFPGMHCPRLSQKTLKAAITQVLVEQDMHHKDEVRFQLQIDKVIQCYEVLLTRHTIMVVGPTGGGKSLVINALAKAQQRAFKLNTKLFPMCSKALTVAELYGVLDPTTRDWTDGLLSKTFREVNEPLKADQYEARYILFDSDVDALWVENMNSVMDDNKLLTLANGERIRLQDHCKLVFEVADLQYASPATVSRAGMVWVDPKNLGFLPYFSRWVKLRCHMTHAQLQAAAAGAAVSQAAAAAQQQQQSTALLGAQPAHVPAAPAADASGATGDLKMAELLHALYERYVPHCVEFVLDGLFEGKAVKGGPLSQIIPIDGLNMMKQFCHLFNVMLPPEDQHSLSKQQQREQLEEKSGDGSAAAAPSAAAPGPAVGADGKPKDELSALLDIMDSEVAAAAAAAATDEAQRSSAAQSANDNAARGELDIDTPEHFKVARSMRDPEIIESIFVLCLAWSIGGALTQESRIRFDKFVKQLSGRPSVPNAGKNHLPEELIYDHYFSLVGIPRWTRWHAPHYIPPSPFAFSQIVVPTVDTVRYTWFTKKLMLEHQVPLLFVGQSGTAKTVTVRNYVASLDPSKFVSLTVNMSSRTSSLDVQANIESNVEKRTGHVYGPTPGKQMVIFVDDLNMPKVDEYGTQQPIELLRFLVDRGVMFDRGIEDKNKSGSSNSSAGERFAKKTFRDLLYVSAMAPPGGGRSAVNPRFLSLFSVISMCFPTEDALHLIYSSMLMGHVEAHAFTEDVKSVASKLTSVTIRLYRELVQQLPATPSKFHYIFNLRDLSRVYEGLLLSTPDKFDTPGSLLRLWRNECARVFCDRLISEQDRRVVNDTIVVKLVKEVFPDDSKIALREPLIFGDFRHVNAILADPSYGPASAHAARAYEDLDSFDNVKAIFNEVLMTYAEENERATSLVLFQDALEHLTRIHRIIRMPRGHALLVGVGGSGKQSLTKLAAFASQYRVFQISLTRNYSLTDFMNDLKTLYCIVGGVPEPESKSGNAAGAGNAGGVSHGPPTFGQPVVFLFTDAHVKDEGFLELVNNMLTTGMVPALFGDEEKGPLIEAARADAKAKGKVLISRDECWQHFVSVCQDNLHIVLSFTPAGDILRRRCRSFPGLVNNTVIDWFFPWPESALSSVAHHYLGNESFSNPGYRGAIVEHMTHVHKSVTAYSTQFQLELRRSNHVTPKNFLDFLSTYRTQLHDARVENRKQYDRLDGGIKKLVEANHEVERYGRELAAKKIVVDAKSRECATVIAQLKEKQTIVETKRRAATEKEKELRDDEQRIYAENETAQRELHEAEPALEQAASALDTIRKEDIAEIKTMPNPPAAVVAVLQCVVELRPTETENPSDGWKAVKIMLSDPNFHTNLKRYKKEKLQSGQVKRIKAILSRKMQDPKQALTETNLQRISRAAHGLYKWVKAMLEYYRVAKNVEPRRKKVAAMERAMAISQQSLQETRAELIALGKAVEEMSSDYAAKSAELQELEVQAEQMERHLEAASQLIKGLGSERERWGQQRDKLRMTEVRLVGDCLVAASFLSYTGAFTFPFRRRMVYDDWVPDVRARGLPLTEHFKLEPLLSSEVEIARWASEGLPQDELSIQNGILTTRSPRFPLCIDPQMQASKWIRAKESNNGEKEIKIRSFADPDLMHLLEFAIQFGSAFIIENIGEELDPVIDPVLEKNFIQRSGHSKAILLGDNMIDWNDNFRLYLITKFSNPRFSPEIAAKTTIINYTVTLTGLEEQLLGEVISYEREELQKQKEALVQSIARNNIMLVELENNILKGLMDSQTNILDNQPLIDTLKDAKTRSVSVAEQLAEARTNAEDIEKVTDNFRPVARRGAVLFFVVAGLSNISSMYEFSLGAYLEVFRRALELAPRDPLSVAGRVRSVVQVLTQSVYDYACTGIFERHKLMLSLQIALLILDSRNRVDKPELEFFLKGNVSLDEPSAPKPAAWIPTSAWRDLCRLAEVSALGVEHIKSNAGADAAKAAEINSVLAVTTAAAPHVGADEDGDDDDKNAAALAARQEEERKQRLAIESASALASKQLLANIVQDVTINHEVWRQWYDLTQPEVDAELGSNQDDGSVVTNKSGAISEFATRNKSILPGEYNQHLSLFQRLLVLRCFRPDRVYAGVKSFVISELGSYFVQPPVLNYDRILRLSSPLTPIVFILSPGADPQSALQSLATQRGFFPAKFKSLALGQGQASAAETLLQTAYHRGHWLVLANCHLLTKWLKTLEKLLNTMQKPHPDFRLWLTTDPHPDFPLGILQRALKVVTEPPDGLKLNMKSSYSKIAPEELEDCPHRAYRPLVYVLSFFHAVVQERRKYGKLGWNVAYDFNDSDFNVSRRLLKMYLTKAYENTEGNAGSEQPIPWGSLRYLIGEAMYGGRVTDSLDRRILVTYLDEYMGDFLFDDCQPYYFSRSGFDYTIPAWGPLDSYAGAIDHLPLDNSPEVFGLHSNADIRYNTNAVRSIWGDIIALQPRTEATAGGGTREDYVSKVAREIQAKVPEPFDLAVVRRDLEKRASEARKLELANGGFSTAVVGDITDPSQMISHTGAGAGESAQEESISNSGNSTALADPFSAGAAAARMTISPTTVVLLQELERWNKLVVRMQESLAELLKALAGLVGMSAELDDLSVSLFNGTLPAAWRRLAPATEKHLGSWMAHFQRRYEQYVQWVEDENGQDPKVMWLPGLHIPESYVTALVQTTCRRKGWPLDKSTTYTKVTRIMSEAEVVERPRDGCYVTGLHLEGAGWDVENSCLKRQDPKILTVELPILHIIPIESNKLKLQNTFKTPVYVTQARRNAMGVGLVFHADLATPVHESHWILQGTALVLNRDD